MMMRHPFFTLLRVWLLSSFLSRFGCWANNETDTNNNTTVDDGTNTMNNNVTLPDLTGEHLLTMKQKVLLNAKFEEGSGKVIDGHYIIRLSESRVEQAVQEAIADLAAASGMDIQKVEKEFVKAFKGFSWEETNEEEKWKILVALLESDLVEMIEEDQEVSTQNDTVCPMSWGLDRIDQNTLPLDGIYHYDWNGSSVDVFILDTGIRSTHSQFEGRATCAMSMVPGEDCEDGNGHGVSTLLLRKTWQMEGYQTSDVFWSTRQLKRTLTFDFSLFLFWQTHCGGTGTSF